MSNTGNATPTVEMAERAAIARWENEGGHTVPLETHSSLPVRADVSRTITPSSPSHARSDRSSGTSQ